MGSVACRCNGILLLVRNDRNHRHVTTTNYRGRTKLFLWALPCGHSVRTSGDLFKLRDFLLVFGEGKAKVSFLFCSVLRIEGVRGNVGTVPDFQHRTYNPLAPELDI